MTTYQTHRGALSSPEPYRPRRLPSILNPRVAERETTGRRFCYGFDCGCIDGHFDAAIEAFAKAVA